MREDGSYEVLQGYYLCKQTSLASPPGINAASTIANRKHVHIIAFSSNGTENPDAFVLLNPDEKDKPMNILLKTQNVNYPRFIEPTKPQQTNSLILVNL